MHKGQFKYSKVIAGKASPVPGAVLPYQQVLHCHLNAFLAQKTWLWICFGNWRMFSGCQAKREKRVDEEGTDDQLI